jgi:hypothetical protein
MGCKLPAGWRISQSWPKILPWHRLVFMEHKFEYNKSKILAQRGKCNSEFIAYIFEIMDL